MPVIRYLGAFLLLGLVSACASFPGGSRNAPVSSATDSEAAQVQVAALESEVVKLKSQNARLANELLALKRERDQQLSEGNAPELKDPAPDLPPAPEMLVDGGGPRPNAVVDDAASPALAKTDVPVETSPRLVQPTFASNETVFENEAEGDIKTESVLFGVHLASYRHMEEARTGWRQLQRENPDELGLLEPRLEGVDVEGKGRFLRLIGGGFASKDKAEVLCGQLKAKGLFCSVASFEGERLSLAENGG
ncbi:SPOR domain-containing protein [Marinicaulis aureus]|uniref:SPOR domain-containing protein n=1 Tax=Hyphococcus aureus TaxID=2666033 RepID=A0ABW1KY22_9PROT